MSEEEIVVVKQARKGLMGKKYGKKGLPPKEPKGSARNLKLQDSSARPSS